MKEFKNKEKEYEQDNDKKVERMIKTWDIVKCRFCGKHISMLTAIPLRNGEGFICRSH